MLRTTINWMVEILAFGINFSRFKDILDLQFMGIFFNIMYKTHPDIETKILGRKCVFYMHVYNVRYLEVESTLCTISSEIYVNILRRNYQACFDEPVIFQTKPNNTVVITM